MTKCATGVSPLSSGIASPCNGRFFVPIIRRMELNDLIKHFGSRAKAQQRLGLYRQLWDQWEKRGGIPAMRQFQIQVLTRGRLKATNGK